MRIAGELGANIGPDSATRSRAARRRIILALIGLGLFTRLPFFNLPVQADEAAMYTWYCVTPEYPVLHVITHYGGPHNHVLHSVLFTALYTVFGWGFPWLRLPALLAGVACVPLSYVVLRRIIGHSGAIIAAVLVAFSGWAVRYATDARGYSLAMMLGLIAVGLIWHGRRRGSPLHVAAAGFVIGCAVGTVPTMIHLAAAIGVWLALCPGPSSAPRRAATFRHVVLYSGMAATTAALWYAPIISFMGLDALWRYPGVHALPFAQLLSDFPRNFVAQARMLSNGALPTIVFWVLVGVGAIRLHRTRPAAALLLGIVLILPVAITLILRRLPPERAMIFMIPFAAAPAAVGVVHLANLASLAVAAWHSQHGRRVATAAATLILFFSAASAFATRWPVPLPGVDDKPDVAPVARFLAAQANEDAFIFARTGVSEPLQYHLARLGRPFERVGMPRPKNHVTDGVLVRQKGAGLGIKLSRFMQSYEATRVLFQNEAYAIWRVRRTEAPPTAQIAFTDGDGI
ncbi:MAG: glycosyltransferase family 39 protein [Phycisphaerae bacterium]